MIPSFAATLAQHETHEAVADAAKVSYDWGALLTTSGLIALLTITALEVVLGVDNIVFIALISNRTEEKYHAKVRTLGLFTGATIRILMLLGLSWMFALDKKPLFHLAGEPITIKALIMLAGGIFLLGKTTMEIHHKIRGVQHHDDPANPKPALSIAGAIGQILVINVVFSLDSVITAVGMTHVVPVMILSVLFAVFVMVAFAGIISRFINKHPSLQILALGFLLMIGALLIAEGFGKHLPRGYVYFAMAFSLVIELVNMRYDAMRSKAAAKQIH
ncbi:MAG: TerC family protein [Phycisphaeraceae bacterium]|nr:TerC family protein [Phycisphaeraceae bacterium]